MESIFAVGVDEMSWDDLDTTHYEWPTVESVMAYRRTMRSRVDEVINTLPLTLPITWESPWWAILMSVEHERIHLETSSVLIRQHGLDHVKPHPAWQPCRSSGKAPENEMIAVAAGHIVIGKDRVADSFYGWDNEYGHHEAEVGAFQASRYLVSNQEFLSFVEAGGYQADKFWEEEGLAWRKHTGAAYPTFWVRKGDQWLVRLMTEEIPMPLNWPVETNYHEAKAFCNWKAETTGQPVRLPTEDEWYRLYEVAGLAEIAHDAPAKEICISIFTHPAVRWMYSSKVIFTILLAMFGNGRKHRCILSLGSMCIRYTMTSLRQLLMTSTISSRVVPGFPVEMSHLKRHAMLSGGIFSTCRVPLCDFNVTGDSAWIAL